MWRRTYLLLLLLRVYFALSPSYLHPDEVFQGPEVIAGRLQPPLTARQLADQHLQVNCSATRVFELGNGPSRNQFEACSHYGQFTGYPWPC